MTKFALAMHAARQVPLTRLGLGQGAHGPFGQGLACRNGVKTVKLVEATINKHQEASQPAAHPHSLTHLPCPAQGLEKEVLLCCAWSITSHHPPTPAPPC